MLAYVSIIMPTLFLVSLYIISSLRDHFYDKERVDLFTKANVFASTNAAREIKQGNNFDVSTKELIMDQPIRLIVLDPNALVVYDNERNTNMTGKLYVNASVKEALKRIESSNVYDETDGTNSIDVAVPIVLDGSLTGIVYLSTSLEEIDVFLTDIQKQLIVLSIIASLIIALLSALLAGMITAPLTKLTKLADQIASGNFNSQVPVRGSDEIARLGETFNAMTAQLMELEEKRNTFVSDASHELKTPLASIKLLSESILQSPDIDPDMVREFLEDMTGEVDRLSRIVDRLLTLSKSNSQRNKLELETVNMNKLLVGIIRKLSPLAREKRIVINYKYEPETDLEMLLDRDKIYEAIYNIIDNSIKYTERKGIVSIRLATDSASTIIEIEDNGVGIPKDDVGLIFERFYRVDKARARETGGTGLGLSIALEAVNLHNGHIEVFSEEGEGSRFVIILPYTGK